MYLISQVATNKLQINQSQKRYSFKILVKRLGPKLQRGIKLMSSEDKTGA